MGCRRACGSTSSSTTSPAGRLRPGTFACCRTAALGARSSTWRTSVGPRPARDRPVDRGVRRTSLHPPEADPATGRRGAARRRASWAAPAPRMIFTETRLPGAYTIDLEPIEDERGFFARQWCEQEVEQHG